jgi:hypothetical protein
VEKVIIPIGLNHDDFLKPDYNLITFMNILNWILKYRSIPLNLLFAAYLIFLQPIVVQRLQQTRSYTRIDPLVGYLLIALQLMELIGAALKLPMSSYLYLHRFNRKIMNSPTWGSASVGCLLFPWIFHLLIAVILGFFALDMLVSDQSSRGWLGVAMVFLVIFKETAFIALNNPVIGTGDPSNPPSRNNPLHLARTSRGLFTPPKQISIGLAICDLLGDLMLLAYGVVGFTVLWDANPFFTGSAWGLDLFAFIYFFVIYVSLRGIYFMQDVFLESSRMQKIASLLSFCVVLIVSMRTLPWR